MVSGVGVGVGVGVGCVVAGGYGCAYGHEEEAAQRRGVVPTERH